MKKIKKLKKRYIALIVALVIVAGGFLFQKPLAVLAFDLFLSDQVETKLAEESYQPLENNGTTTTTVKPAPVVYKSDPFSLMLLGTDQRGNEVARSDTMIYAVIRPEDYKILLISIPVTRTRKLSGMVTIRRTKSRMLMLLAASKWLKIPWKHCWAMIFNIMPQLIFRA